ncbi:MAG: hypothetical protein JWO72_2773 [Caulobacteraceae bacterium]|nr:hypothetical protein [Caulobacteraceae bacterium]
MSTADDLDLLAQEELAQASSMRWSQLAPLIPWGDTFEGVSPANLTVQLSRSYLWAGEPGGDILCEVRAYLDEAHYDYGARRSALIRRS